ncbi:MAG: hypothetical protein IPJ82_00130 [Lewinellaceae bacterium]|nr:hypothetical protein [Lewinellaceae bacterium]
MVPPRASGGKARWIVVTRWNLAPAGEWRASGQLEVEPRASGQSPEDC